MHAAQRRWRREMFPQREDADEMITRVGRLHFGALGMALTTALWSARRWPETMRVQESGGMMMMMITGRVERGTEAHGAPFHVPANLAVVEVVSGAVSVICDCVLFAYTFRRASGVDCCLFG